MSDIVLKTRELCKSFGGRPAVDRVSMEIGRGRIYGFIGKNGAGKTTFMRMVCGLAAPNSGEIELLGKTGRDLTAARRRIGGVIETPSLYPNMTAYENMEARRREAGSTAGKERIARALALAGIADTGRKKARAFSLGMKQRLGLALALLEEPEFLILDEPINGLDPTGIADVRETLKSLAREKGVTVLISSHILSELHLLANDYGIIHNGRLIKQLTADELKNECRRFVSVETDDPIKAGEALKSIGVADFDAADGGELRIYDQDADTARITAALVSAGAVVRGVSLQGQDLEQYFLGLIGEGGPAWAETDDAPGRSGPRLARPGKGAGE
ncbi:MAG: ATP-binding cassette domain-containing protein [Firmicutes bacterium]|nr:ATP-binding cassette domain-containing protein [Bacillota bacterium]